MDDLERQLRTWADTAASEDAGESVTGAQIRASSSRPGATSDPGDGVEAELGAVASAGVDGRSGSAERGAPAERAVPTGSAEEDLALAPTARGNRRRWLAAAAVVAVLSAVGAVVVATGGDETEPLEVGTTTSSTSTSEVDPLAGPVGFEVLGVAPGGVGRPWGPSTVARSRGEVAQLWAEAGLAGPSPAIDPDEQVVVAMTLVEGACGPAPQGLELRGFRREGSTIEPQVAVPAGPCDQQPLGLTVVVALEWATVGDAFTLHVPAQTGADLPEVTQEVQRLPADPEVEVTWELDEVAVAAGDPLTGTVTVENRSGAPIEGTTCGPFFGVRLRGPDAEQVIARPACASAFSVPEGVSTYDLEGVTTFTMCTSGPSLTETQVCDPGGSLPVLPAGTYEAMLDQALPGLVPPPDPIEVAIT